MTRTRLPDIKNAGRSEICPFIPGEHATNRHRRRLQTNLSAEQTMSQWAAEHGLTLRICNEGHHWIFERPGFFAEWWPSSAKLVFGKRYDRGIHCHDHEQARRLIGRKL